MATKKRKKKKPAIEMTLFGVVLSYPDLDKPKPYKGKTYYRTDCLMEDDHAQLKELRGNIAKVKRMAWGEDKTEWPEGLKALLQNGDNREDQKAYHGKFYITASTQQQVPVVNPKGKDFNAAMVKGGMTANVAIRISAWEYDGDEGISIYLQGVQIDTSVAKLSGFGGGKSVKQMFNLDGDDDDSDDSDSDDEDDDSDEDDTPRSKKKKPARDEDDSDSDSDDEDEDAPPKRKKKKPARDEDDDSDSDDEDDEDDEDAPPKRKKKSSRRNFDEDDED